MPRPLNFRVKKIRQYYCITVHNRTACVSENHLGQTVQTGQQTLGHLEIFSDYVGWPTPNWIPVTIAVDLGRKATKQTNKQTKTLNAPIATKVVCFARLPLCLRSLYGKQYESRSDCSYRSSLFWVHAVCFYTLFVSNVQQFLAADDFSRWHFQVHFFLGA